MLEEYEGDWPRGPSPSCALTIEMFFRDSVFYGKSFFRVMCILIEWVLIGTCPTCRLLCRALADTFEGVHQLKREKNRRVLFRRDLGHGLQHPELQGGRILRQLISCLSQLHRGFQLSCCVNDLGTALPLR